MLTVVDLLVATLLLVLLALVIVSIMHWTNVSAIAGPGNEALFDVGSKLAALSEKEDFPWWVAAMHLSTFLPSLLHLSLLLYAFPMTWLPQSWNLYLGRQIDTDQLPGRPMLRMAIAGWQSFRIVAPFGVVFFGFYGVLTWGGTPDTLGYLGRSLLGLVTRYAEWIGAIDGALMPPP